ncbi:ATP synthase subunit b [Maioricimonas rarisocia]|uniref:ATP synthase subunit b n=1 Tax=Maioricimonas rarisocia TaxID=2528026 RepID=A0A517Z981_9PLAN|nr:hypothetical protein [Maioricimonas rarisocia]QDU39038.1 ATP synthase subunit b [Maioricimonas rarisocia]
MQIDWFTFGAQVFNFLILVALLHRLLYRPILHAMEEREADIVQRIEAAEEQRRAAQREQDEYRKLKEELASAREQYLSEARADVETWRLEAFDHARQDVDQQRQEWRRALHREQQRLLDGLRERAVRQVQQISRQVLEQLADTGLERQIVSRFIERLKTLDDGQLNPIREELGHGDGSRLVVRTAFPADEEQQHRLLQALRDLFGDQLDIAFESTTELVCGIELIAADRKLAWNVDDYLESLDHALTVAVEHAESVRPDDHTARRPATTTF